MPDAPAQSVSAHACDPWRPLARRLGVTVHVSPLRMRLRRLMAEYPSPGAEILEDWLLDLANVRGVRAVARGDRPPEGFVAPSASALSDEELIVAICQPQNLDRPQSLRAAAELVSRGAVDVPRLLLVARCERADRVLAELARQARRVERDHPAWAAIDRALGRARPLRSPLLHWTRLAFPVPDARGCSGRTWRLVA